MAVITKNSIYELTDPIFDSFVSWHSKIGQDGFPKKFIWEGDSGITQIKNLKVEYDNVTGVPKKITAEDQNSKSISIEITRSSNTCVKATMKYDGTAQAEIKEEILTGTFGDKLRLTGTYSSDSDLNFQIESEYKTVNPKPNSSVWLKLTFNNNNYEFWLKPSTSVVEDFPQALKDYNNDLASFAKQGTVTALNTTMIKPMALSVYQYLSSIRPGMMVPCQTGCILIIVIVDNLTTPLGSLVAFIVNLILIYLGVPL
jgi:hypothetical protein